MMGKDSLTEIEIEILKMLIERQKMGKNMQSCKGLFDCKGCSNFYKSEDDLTLETTDNDFKRLRPSKEIAKIR